VKSLTLKECGEEKAKGMFHPKCRRKVSSFFTLHLFIYFLCLKRRRCQEKVFEIEGQKREPKVRGQSKRLKESSLLSLHFLIFYVIFFSLFFFSFSFV